MNNKQRIAMALGVICLLVRTFVVPPKKTVGEGWLSHKRVDSFQMIAESLVIISATGGAVLMLKKKDTE
jgi:hypothetical protein